MKKILAILAVLVLAGLVVLGVFLATFDANRYRPLIVRELERTLGRPVRLEGISLGWRRGIALQCAGFAIFEDAAARGEPLIQVETASALVRLRPLLRKEVRVSSVVLHRPRIRVSRDAQGNVNLLGLAAAAAPAGAARPAAGPRESAVSFNVASLRVTDGTLRWTDAVAQPPADLQLDRVDVTVTNIAPGQPMAIEMRGALASESPNVRLSGRLTLPRPSGRGGRGRPAPASGGSLEEMRLAIERLPLEAVLPASAGSPQLRGTLTLSLEGSAPTLDPSQALRAASGRGTVKLDDAVIANLNVLRTVFEKLAMIPGLVEQLEARLPESERAKLTATDTVLEPIDLAVTLQEGVLRFGDLRVQTDAFGLSGDGRVGLDGTVDVRSTLRIDPALSAALIRSVNELQGLANAQGELELPLAVQGQAQRLAVLPDLQYVASKLLATKAIDLLGKVLKRQEQDQPDVGTEPGQSGSPEGDLLDRALQRILGPQDSSDAPQQ
ncbi:MAG: AsmA family protein [Candidatus Omnitrophica bacterium]|nr:AsmA family protein [Candidatus Omnitrophota bacterium]